MANAYYDDTGADDVGRAIKNLASAPQAAPAAPSKRGTVVAVFGCKGGSGATTIAASLAGALLPEDQAARTGQVVLIDEHTGRTMPGRRLSEGLHQAIEAKEGVTTGISAHDRARTVAVAIDASHGADDIATPGHVFPLRAKQGGVLVRAGHTEAAIDLASLAGLYPCAAICEILNDDGSMARTPELATFKERFGLKMISIAALIEYRSKRDKLVGLKETTETTCTGVEMFNKSLDEGMAGDNVGLLLRGTKKDEIQRGQVLAAPGSIPPHTTFEGQVYVLCKEEGGRHTPFFNGYRPQFYFRTTDVTGSTTLLGGAEMCMPGDNVEVEVELGKPIAMSEGSRFAIREGGRTVGSGVVTKIVE